MRKPFLYALCATIALACCVGLYTTFDHYRNLPLDARSDQPDVAEIAVRFHAQTDPRWADKPMGARPSDR